jgi:AcrR family transcriptional regulator
MVLERCGTAAAGPHGLRTADRLLIAAIAEFDEQGYVAASVDGIVKRARVAHGTFYRYFGSKEQLFRALAQNALSDMEALGRRFPAVTACGAGRRRLREWVALFCETYAAHSAVLRNLSQAEVVGPELSAQGLRPLFAIAEAMAAGMTSANPAQPESSRPGSAQPASDHAELTAISCLMMLERVNYLTSVQVKLTADVSDRLAEIVFAAFFPPPLPPPDPRRQAAEAARLDRIRHRRRQR